jgi:hypothetical protein
MNTQSRILRILPILTIIATAVLTIAATPARADRDIPITVYGWHGIGFGTMFRSSTSSVNYSSAAAAQFIVTGKRGKNVRISISTSAMSNGSSTMRPTVHLSDCAYSLDNGSTWTSFASGSLYQDTSFPSWSMSSTSWILVRVGGTLTSASSQARGTYTGTFTVTSVYR